ncbi:bifunctional phosphopantothenoylcysteine decarboxylase/phosphopantothenate--cysteine ligase CoaBC [Desulfovibrio sp. JC022]|uniref:bifunctional phosphopantothenoylcysteine decarboxylase/phosphopantothenate--cysteine ligase CoaBC n=1 Tax=Desulfovibrio sp. JC022 TaxID=2593642 RepID=UPI0013D4D370|nr:bifunctional phosphopantothenoylcysteine decarboxylase/phosphopantothenate--cysteine ligase CoaBC [Desulfovibrio sp. JC022]NDV24104.1 bifunctional phosphopantothenoylcysteine decarboxylase/phosphopantothenate--cysteine ligase CoaBC [Desulfovibrio sp. JC022]
MNEHLNFDCFLGKRIHLGVSGSIAAYKSLDLLRMFRKAGIEVSVTLTSGAQEFIKGLSYEALGAFKVWEKMYPTMDDTFGHLEPGQAADAMLVAPATASVLARMTHGLADDMLSCQGLAFSGPKLVAPAMNPAMWDAPATQDNCRVLAERGVEFIGPDCGDVACGDHGRGRLAPLESIYAHGLRAVAPDDMSGKHVLITLGPTREKWDAVRFWSNPSSGLMGACIAMAAWLRGAKVTVVSGPVNWWFPEDIDVIKVDSAQQMYDAATAVWPGCTTGCFTAAVADFKPIPHGEGKFKKAGNDALRVDFDTNPDILKTIGTQKRDDQQLIGFAAETSNIKEAAKGKLERKNLDLIVANPINKPGAGFESSTNSVYVLDRTGRSEEWPDLPKTEVAWRIWDLLLQN